MSASHIPTGDDQDALNSAANIVDSGSGASEWIDEEDDDDMDFEPNADSDPDFFDPSEDVDAEFHDAEDGLTGVEIDFSFNDEGGGSQQGASIEGTETGDQSPTPPRATATRIQVSHAQLMHLLGHAGLHRLFTNHHTANPGRSDPDDDDEDVDLDDGYGGFGARRRQRPKGTKTKPPPIPSEEGRKLMNSGSFGTSNHYQRRPRTKIQLATSLMSRELGIHRRDAIRTTKLLSHVIYHLFRIMIPASVNARPGPHTVLNCRHHNSL
jgi:WD repeat-containing protein 23